MEAAADVGNLSEVLRGAGAPGSDRANPVALEVRVNATGARPSKRTEKRELFSEDTQTVLVFPDAAVIAMNAAVVPGQLVFLTNKENNREVVCQVIRKRNNRPTSCYVELQFTEAQTDFWGVVFPEKPDKTGAEPQTTPVEERVVSAEATEEPAAAPVAEPNSEEVQSLRQEVDALREQLKALTEAKKREAEAAEEAARKAAEAEADAAIAALAAKRAAAKPLIRMSLPGAPGGAEPPGSVSADSVSTVEPLAPTMTLPAVPGVMTNPPAIAEKPMHSEEREAFEDLLPQPELDFSRAPTVSRRPEDDDPYSIYKPLRKKVGIRDVILTVAATLLLAGGVGFAWYKDKLPMMRRKAPTAAANAKNVAVAKPAAAMSATTTETGTTPTGAVSQPKSEAGVEDKSRPLAATASGAASGGDGNRAGATDGTVPPASGVAAATVAEDTSPKRELAAEPGAREKKTVSTGKRATPVSGKRRGKPTEAAAVPAAPEAEPATDAPVEAAKLVRAGKPVYPPDAMRNFITGDVRISAEVGTDGHVGRVTVISGPAALREAAVEAMKQYEYEPATRGGKAVASQVTVTIKFWFDP